MLPFFSRCAVPNAAKFQRITEVCSAPNGAGLTPKELKWRQVFDVVDIMDTLVLYRKSVAKEFTDLAGNFNLECPRIAQQHEVFDIIDRCHHQIAHGKTFLTWKRVNQYYSNISQEMIREYINLCTICSTQESAKSKRMRKLKPILTKTFNDRGQVDLVDMQSTPDGEYKWILNYQDHLTKFIVLRALRNKSK